MNMDRLEYLFSQLLQDGELEQVLMLQNGRQRGIVPSVSVDQPKRGIVLSVSVDQPKRGAVSLWY